MDGKSTETEGNRDELIIQQQRQIEKEVCALQINCRTL